MPITKTVSIRSLRQNLSKFLKESQEKNVHFVVMKHAEPIARLSPVGIDPSLESLIADVAQARKDIAEGKVYSSDEVLAMIDANEARILRKGSKRH